MDENNSDKQSRDEKHSANNACALTVCDLSWHADDRVILSDISFSLAKGEMLGIIGPNGAGKSSLLRCLYRYIKPDNGTINLFGQNTSYFSAKEFARQVAVVLQDTPHHFELTTDQLVAIGLTPHKGPFDLTTSADRRLVADALEKVGLTHKAGQVYEHLSGGEKQRALIARAIVQQPKLLILDEPTNHLDIRYQIQVMELLREIGISVITSIHDLNLASAMCDQILLLDDGRCVAHGTPKSVLTEERISEVFGVCCSTQAHPQHGNPQISYFYGYSHSENAHGKSAHDKSQWDGIKRHKQDED
ncbi:ABC transporter ATP-binding protein [Shewanella canadensis]|uniref:ABC transporter ATP-binding protein n=1 Tax=Shewanella canadensis TaxID=271096 RepID=A0A431WY32_9GAMM|nr:ABC transporter ATP-binding protein [Shewanella canadensis]RTR40329.1 ABC transporter ATP-binding protein [Shewanella canadensis]